MVEIVDTLLTFQMPAGLEYSVIDAFTTVPFRGNPAAVILFTGDSYPPEPFLRNIAIEFNLSETAFLLPHSSSTSTRPSFFLRWKTPDGEDVPLCGHATLASSHFLFNHHFPTSTEIEAVDFHTLKSGVLSVRLSPKSVRNADEVSPAIEMDFPENISSPLHEENVDVVRYLLEAFRGKPGGGGAHIRAEGIEYVGRTGDGRIVVIVNESVDIALLEHIDHPTLAKIGSHMISVSSRVPETFAIPFESPTTGQQVKPDYLVRVFCPLDGTDEDPVTGSAQTALVPYWTEQGVNGKHVGDTIFAYQAYPGRGGMIELLWEKERGRVRFVGRCRTVMQGTLYY
ncbi:hypothetical protein BJ742DRAFT_845304 [Cladochytrium replicatum]|nr:hypothetical protein BJ742DRAFT_845304 [Cladochytrium replicatum]